MKFKLIPFLFIIYACSPKTNLRECMFVDIPFGPSRHLIFFQDDSTYTFTTQLFVNRGFYEISGREVVLYPIVEDSMFHCEWNVYEYQEDLVLKLKRKGKNNLKWIENPLFDEKTFTYEHSQITEKGFQKMGLRIDTCGHFKYVY